MTCREKLMKEHPNYVGKEYVGGCHGCPHDYNYLPRPDYCKYAHMTLCKKCWDREIPGTELPYTRSDKELNDKIAELMRDYENLVSKAKRFGLDIRLYDDSETLVLYYNDDYPDTLLVDKDLSSKRKLNEEERK